MPKTILIVEDDLIMQQVLHDIFEMEEMNVRITAQGLEAISMVSDASSVFDLAILDMGLPDISGFEALERIREISPDLPILVASGTESFTIMEKINGMDRVHILPKPYNVSRLLTAMEKVMD